MPNNNNSQLGFVKDEDFNYNNDDYACKDCEFMILILDF